MPANFEYTVNTKPAEVGRLNTEQVLTPTLISSVRVTPNAVRTLSQSMDQMSERGTLISVGDTVSITLTYPIEEKPLYDEFLYSIMDYQRVLFDATDIKQIGAVRNFVLTGNTWPLEERGCTHLSYTIEGILHDAVV